MTYTASQPGSNHLLTGNGRRPFIVWSRSATVNETCQRDGSPGAVGAIQAIASSKPGGAATSDCRAAVPSLV
jgi:hypothetical protein